MRDSTFVRKLRKTSLDLSATLRSVIPRSCSERFSKKFELCLVAASVTAEFQFEFQKYSSYGNSTYREKIHGDVVETFLLLKKIRLEEFFEIGKFE